MWCVDWKTAIMSQQQVYAVHPALKYKTAQVKEKKHTSTKDINI